MPQTRIDRIEATLAAALNSNVVGVPADRKITISGVEKSLAADIDFGDIGGTTNASNINTGTLSDNRLSANIAKSVTLEQLRAVTSPTNNQLYYTRDLGREGYWYYDNLDGSTADNTGTVVVSGTKRFKRVLTGVIDSMWFGVGDGATNDLAQLQKGLDYAIANKQRFNISSVHSLGSGTLNLSGSNIHIFSTGLGELRTSADKVFNVSGAVSNIVFERVKLTSTGTTGDFYGLFTSENKDIDLLSFIRCKFSATNAITNGIKIINQDSTRAKNIRFLSCDFTSIGQMGIEFQNHNHTGDYRYSNISVIDCTFADTGLNSTHGQALSFSGRGQNIHVIDCKIKGAKEIGIELAVGLKDVTIKDNQLYDLGSGCAAFSFTSSITSGTGSDWMFENVQMSGNISTSEGRVNLYRMKNSNVEGNTFNFTTTSGYMQAKDDVNTDFVNNTVVSNGQYSLFVTNTSGYVCSGNKFQGNIFNNSTSSTNSACLQFDQSGTTGNMATGNVFKKGTGGLYSTQTNSAASNAIHNNFNVDPSTGAIAIDAVMIGSVVLTNPSATVLQAGNNNLYANSLRNYNAAGNSTVQVADDGVRLSRNIASATEPAVRSAQSGAGSTGDIHEFRDPAAAKVATVKIDGTIYTVTKLQAPNTPVSSTPTDSAVAVNASTGDLEMRPISGLWTTVRLPSDQAVANSTPDTYADVTGLSFAVVSGAQYEFEAFIIFDAAATTTGSRWSVNGPTLSYLNGIIEWTNGSTTTLKNVKSGYDGGSSSSTSISANNVCTMKLTFECSASGTLIVRFANEEASSAITAKAGKSFIKYRRIT